MSDPRARASSDLKNRPDGLLAVTTDEVPGRSIQRTIGLVRGNTIRARHVGKDITAVFKMVVGGEIDEYTKMMAEAREQALDRMKARPCNGGPTPW